MNTDACNVEDVNIPHIKECLSLSFVAPIEDWSNIFRTRSFTLLKNDLILTTCLILRRCQSPYHRRQQKSVRVLCEQTGWLFIYKSPREDQFLSAFHSEQLYEQASKTSLPVLSCCSVGELRGN